ncbi:uncharacterized protein [Nicotiana tomentosiformis]|uniref:uncharacterized protein n=1 Tax=Nicotiana tomentosiformis TaxID=4098 RepID=UPI00388C5175
MVICEPIFKLLKKDAATKWTEECQKAFDRIKEYLSNPPVLVPPEFGKPLLLYLSALDNAFGCVLGQHGKTGRNEFNIVYITQKAIKGQALANHLAKNPVDGDYEPLTMYFPDEEVLFAGEDIAESYLGWRRFFDGATNLNGDGIVAVLILESGQHYPASAKIRFPCTNNMAKYEACILGIRMAVNINVKELFVHQECQDTSHPDKNYIDPIEVEIRDQHAYCFHVDEEPDGKSWYHDISKFLATIEYVENATNGQKRCRGNQVIGGNKCRNVRTPHEWVHISQEDLGSWILLDDYGKRQYPLRAEVSQVLDSWGFHLGSANELNVMDSPWPFAAWGMDVIGPIENAASKGHLFILVVIDYITKSVKASTYKAVTKKVVADFV